MILIFSDDNHHVYNTVLTTIGQLITADKGIVGLVLGGGQETCLLSVGPTGVI